MVYGTSYVSPLVEVFRDVYIGERSFVATNTVLRAAPERRLEIGSETNAQDNIIVRALNQSASIGNETSLAHHAIVRDSTISDFAFVGFDAEVVNSTVERGALISAKALIQDVTLPENALVPPGGQITTQEQATPWRASRSGTMSSSGRSSTSTRSSPRATSRSSRRKATMR